MDILNVLKTVGTGLLSSHPLGVAAIPVINAFLPKDKQLNNNSTGTDAQSTIDTLPAAARESLLLARINLKVEEERGRTTRYEAMCTADGQETRAKLVNKAMNHLIILTYIFVLATAYVYVTKGAEQAFSYAMATVFLTVTGTFTYVVRAYFGDLRTETQSRHGVESGAPSNPGGIAGIISAIRGK